MNSGQQTSSTYLECLERIIEIEKTSHTQEKLISALDSEMALLGIPKTFAFPERIQTYVPPVEYNRVNESFDTDRVGGCATIGAVATAIMAFLYKTSISGLLDGLANGFVFFFLGLGGGALVGLIMSLIAQANARKKNEKSRIWAQNEADRRCEAQRISDEEQYNIAVRKYNSAVESDRVRVAREQRQKRELLSMKNELTKKHNVTLDILNRFYDFADIYDTYRNIVATCYIHEYLKSGICEKLSGRDGAYMIFKYEMYEKLKIEKLDTIIYNLETLHFDNINLNTTLDQIGSKFNLLISEVREMQFSQIKASEKNEMLLESLNNRIDTATDQLTHQNAILAYNEQCAVNELKQIKWLNAVNK